MARSRPGVSGSIGQALPWVAIEAVVNVLYGAGMVGVIGWLIPPTEFGAASAALATVLLIETLSGLGVQDAIIRDPSGHTAVTDAGHAMSLAASAIGVVAALAAALPVAAMVGDPRIAGFTAVASLMLPLNALDAVPLGMMMRKMRAAQITRRQIISKLVSLAVLAVGGQLGLGAWAVILASVTVPMVSVVNIWLMMTRYPRLRWDTVMARRLAWFGIATSAELACWAVMSRVFTLAFGAIHGVQALGSLQLAVRLVDEVANLIRLVAMRLGLSAFARLSRAGGDIGRAFQKGTKLISALSTPTFAGLALLAPDLISVAFGPRWAESAVFVQIFALGWLFAMPRILVSPALRAIGKQYLQLAYAIVSALTVLGAMTAFGYLSPLLGALALTSRQVVAIPWSVWTIRSLLGVRIRAQAAALAPALIASGAMAASIEIARHWLVYAPSMLELMAIIAAGGAIYSVALSLTDRSIVKFAINLIIPGHPSRRR